MKSHVELFKEYHYAGSLLFSTNKAGNVFSHLSTAVSNSTTDLLDIEQCRVALNDVLDYFTIRKKFNHLVYKSNGKLSFEQDKFKLMEHEFTDLDEVERALKNKAFL